MKRYEYMTVDLSAEPSFNVHVKLDRYIAKLNEIQFLSEKLRIRKKNKS